MRGMMFRESMAQNRGMLFIHPEEENFPLLDVPGQKSRWILSGWISDRRIVEMSREHAAVHVQDGPRLPQLWRECQSSGTCWK